jgi:hypothetical protein
VQTRSTQHPSWKSRHRTSSARQFIAFGEGVTLWLAKKNVQMLPATAFPQTRKNIAAPTAKELPTRLRLSVPAGMKAAHTPECAHSYRDTEIKK